MAASASFTPVGTFNVNQIVANQASASIPDVTFAGGLDITAATLPTPTFAGGADNTQASISLTVNSIPAASSTIVIGSCTVTFSSTVSDDSNCNDNAAIVNTSSHVTTTSVAIALRSLLNLVDPVHEALSSSGGGSTAIFTTGGAEVSATSIAFTENTGGVIAQSGNVPGAFAAAAAATTTVPAAVVATAPDHSVTIDGVTIDIDSGGAGQTAAQIAATIAAASFVGKDYTVSASGADVVFTKNSTGSTSNNTSLALQDASYTSALPAAATATITVPAGLVADANDHSVTIDGVAINLGTSTLDASQVAAAIAAASFAGKDYTVGASGAGLIFTKNSTGAGGNGALSLQDAAYGARAQVVDFVPAVPTVGETYRASIGANQYDHTVATGEVLADVVADLTTKIDADGLVGCVNATTKVTCTASTPGVSFAPTAEVLDITAPSPVAVSSPANGAATSSVSVHVVGTAEANADLVISGGAATASGAADGSGNFDITVSLTPNLNNHLQLYAIDSSGNTSNPTSLDITHDNTAPSAGVSLSTTTPVKSGAHVVISATFSEPVIDGTPRVALSGAVTLAATVMSKVDSTHYSYDYVVGSGDGVVTVAISGAQDLAGNTQTGTSTSFVVDNTAPILTVTGTSTTVIYGDTYSDAGASSDDGSTVVTDNPVNTFLVGTYTITYSATDAAGNNATTKTRSVEVLKRPITVTALTNSKIYDATTTAAALPSITLGTLASGDSATLSETYDDKTAVSNKTLTPSAVIKNSGNTDVTSQYDIAPVAVTSGVINPLHITGSFTTQNKTYDGSAAAVVLSRSLSGTLGGDDVALVGGTATFASPAAGSSTTVTLAGASLSGSDAANYSLDSVATTSADINAKNLTVTGASAENRVYDNTTNATIDASGASLVGAVSGTVVSLQTSLVAGQFDTKDVGTAKTVVVSGLMLGGADAPNYTLTQPTVSADITPLHITGSFTTQNKTYNGSAAAVVLSRSLSGTLGGDDVALVGGTAIFASPAAGSSTTVTLAGASLSGAQAANYFLSSVGVQSADIAQRTLAVSATGQAKTYDGTTHATVTLSADALSGDTVAVGYTAAAFATSTVASNIPVTVTGISITGGIDAGNYTLGSSTATTSADITKATLHVGATGHDKTYDGTTVASVDFIDDRIAGDTLDITSDTPTFDTRDAGTGKVVTVNNIVVVGASSGNYNWNTATTTSASINKRAITATAVLESKTYDGTTAAVGTPTVGVGAVQTGDSAAFVQAFASRNAGSQNLVPSGSVNDGNGGNNYSYTFASTSGTILPATVSVFAATDSKIYDGTASSTASPTTSALQTGDSVATAPVQAFSDKTVAVGKTITPSGLVVGDGNGGNNYQVAYVATTTGSISALHITGSFTTQNKTYDGSAAAVVLSRSLSGTLGSDDVTLVGGTATFASPAAGSSTTVTLVGASLSGSDAANYALDSVATTSADINKATPTASLATVGSPVSYNGAAQTASVSISASSVPGTVAGVLASSSASQTRAGTYAVTANFVPDDSANYNTLYSLSAGDFVINPLGVTVTLAAGDKTYDQFAAVSSSTLNVVGSIGGDDVSAAGGTVTFDSIAAGSRVATASGYSLSGAQAADYFALNSSASTSATIVPRALSVSATGIDKEYDASTTATVTLNDNRIAGDTLTPTYTSANFLTAGVATNKQVDVYGISISGTNAGNYRANATASTTASIVDTTAPSVTLGGSATTSVLLGNAYVEPGYSATDAVDGSITPVVSGSVNTAALGTYTLTYTATDAHHNSAAKVRDIVVSSGSVSVTPADNGNGTKTGVLTNGGMQSSTLNGSTVSLELPADLAITGPSSWDGTLSVPTTTVASSSPTGNFAIVGSIEVGVPDVEILFDKPVKLTFNNMAGKLVGWSRSGTFTQISNTCSSTSSPTLAAGADCSISDGSDLIVWTRHFTAFSVYQAVSTSGSGSSNGAPVGTYGTVTGSGSGLAVVPTVPAQTGQAGQVLGAAAYRFERNLTLGTSGTDVTELQNVLIAEGYLAAGYNTGRFGSLTKAAVIKYQKVHNITPASGYVGLLTRAELNRGTEATTPVTTGSAKQTLTDAQISAIIGLLQSFGADSATINSVSHALGK